MPVHNLEEIAIENFFERTTGRNKEAFEKIIRVMFYSISGINFFNFSMNCFPVTPSFVQANIQLSPATVPKISSKFMLSKALQTGFAGPGKVLITTIFPEASIEM